MAFMTVKCPKRSAHCCFCHKDMMALCSVLFVINGNRRQDLRHKTVNLLVGIVIVLESGRHAPLTPHGEAVRVNHRFQPP